jgi:hypothetical protein
MAMVPLADIAIELPRLGQRTMRVALATEAEVAPALAEARASGQTICLSCQGLAARLVVDGCMAMDFVHAVLGLPDSLPGGHLSRIERGILHGLLAHLMTRLGFGPELVLHGLADEQLTADVHTWVISTVAPARSGHAFLQAGQEFVRHALDSRRTMTGASIGRVVLAQTTVAAAAIAGAEPSDMVVFDGTDAFADGASWPAQVRVGRHDVAVVMGRDGELGLRSDDREATSASRESDDGADPEVTAEFAELRSQDLAALICGRTIKLDRAADVLVCRAGKRWGEGRLCSLQGTFAVRISRLFRG